MRHRQQVDVALVLQAPGDRGSVEVETDEGIAIAVEVVRDPVDDVAHVWPLATWTSASAMPRLPGR